jgi:hypothetical protein
VTDPDFSRICTETTELLELYGSGKEFEDAKVVAMCKDRRHPEYGSNPAKKLLHYMQELNAKRKSKELDIP